jgi:hypothetical protein
MTFFESIYYKIFGLPDKSELGPVVKYGKKKYYAAQLQDVVIQNSIASTVVFSTVNPNDESKNVSSHIAKKGQVLGRVVDVISGDTTYLAIKNEKGTFFVDPLYLNDVDLQNVLTQSEIDAKRNQAHIDGEKSLFSIPKSVWLLLGLVLAILIISKKKEI